MLIIPLQATPSQTVQVALAGQECKINVYHKFWGLFLDLFVLNKNGNNQFDPIVVGAIGECTNRIVRSRYLGFIGDLAFIDNWQTKFSPSNTANIVYGIAHDPDWDTLGTRHLLVYLEQSDLPALPSLIPTPTTIPSSPVQGTASVATSGIVTLPAGQTALTVVTASCTLSSIVELSPLTLNAAASVTSTIAVPINGAFILTFANNANTDRMFAWTLN